MWSTWSLVLSAALPKISRKASHMATPRKAMTSTAMAAEITPSPRSPRQRPATRWSTTVRLALTAHHARSRGSVTGLGLLVVGTASDGGRPGLRPGEEAHGLEEGDGQED